MTRRWTKAVTVIGALMALVVIGAMVFLEFLIRATPLPDLSRRQYLSQSITSSSGEILWAFLTPDEKWRLPTSESDVDLQYQQMLIAYEDKRFRQHAGVDFIALVRASMQALRYGRSVSGGSTITMQTVRMLEPRPRTFSAKIDQMLKALRLERAMSKQEILRLYLTFAPFGGNVEGVRAASLIYFKKEPKRLSLSEAALLVALPQSPEARRPDRQNGVARTARDRVLVALSARGTIDSRSATRAARNAVNSNPQSLAQNAPHLALRLRSDPSIAADPAIATLVDGNLQRRLERIASREVNRWSDGVSIAVIVLRNSDASVVGYVGGVDLAANSRSGFVDLVQAVRSPGSALKPFIYAMAFEQLLVHPDTIVTDAAVEIAGYRPDNADGQFSGDMSVRQALVRSRNTIAVMLLDKIGVGPFLARFRSAGRPLLLPNSENTAGLAVALGGVGLTLEQLTWFYSAFANEGELKGLRIKPSDPAISLGNFLTPNAARATADILSDVPAPPSYARQLSLDGGRRIGFKTGTSYGFRDAWAVGFDELHTVGVWVGRPDGAAHLGAYGATAAAPILMQVFDLLPVPSNEASSGHAQLGALASFRELPKRLIRLSEPGLVGAGPPLEISFPRNGARIRTDKPFGTTIELPIIAVGGKPPYRWSFEGVQQRETTAANSRLSVDNRGQLEISIMDSIGSIARSSFWLD
jgi:penicillin-binding protein 1C